MQPLADLRQLPPQQQLQLRGIAIARGLHQVTEIIKRLQQILDLMRQAGSRLVHSLQVAHLLQLARPPFGQVVFASQPGQQLHVPDQDRTQRVPRIDG